MMNHLKDIFASRTMTIVLAVLFAMCALFLVFRIGVVIGSRRASVSYEWGQNYHRVFGGPPRGIFGDLSAPGDMKPHGVFGTIIKNENGTLIVESEDHLERSVIVDTTTEIRKLRDRATLQDLIPHTKIVVIGSPAPDGRMTARLIRIIPSPSL